MQQIKLTLVAFCLIFSLLLAACDFTEELTPINIDSTQFSNLAEKQDFLEQHVSFRREYLELEYLIHGEKHTHNSGLSISLVAKVPKNTLQEWQADMEPIMLDDTTWLDYLPEAISVPERLCWFKQGNQILGVNAHDSIIVYRQASL